MLNMDLILQRLQLSNQQITSQIIKDLIADHAPTRAELIRKYNAYKASGLPISSREMKGTNKANNKLINDFRGEIVDQLTGYLFGNPVNYSLNTYGIADPSKDTAYQANLKILKDFKDLNKLAELDGETGKMMSVCGRAARLAYVDTKGRFRVMDVPPWECIFIYDQSLDEVQYAMRYYEVLEMINGSVTSKTRVEWYDNVNVSYYISSGTEFIPDMTTVRVGLDLVEVTTQPHMFSMIPMIDFQNNKELQGDFEKHESLINAYDLALSDVQNEIEELRMAYLLFYGVMPDEKTIAKAKESGAFGAEVGDRIEYLIKNINDAFIEHQKTTLRENIYRFSKTVDVNADTFTGSGASGEARKWLLLALENRGSKTALKFKSGVQKMFEVIATGWTVKGIKIDPLQIEVLIDRNLPVELKMEAEIQATLKGVVSDRTRLRLFSPVKDVDEEMEQMQKENELKVDLDQVPLEGEEEEEEGAGEKDKAGESKPPFGKGEEE